MFLARYETEHGPRWAADGCYLAESFDLRRLLAMPRVDLSEFIQHMQTTESATGSVLAPLEATQEVWAAGVTYQRSREARRAESDVGDVYDRVYAAARPELFFKSIGWRVAALQQPLRIRADSAWNVPEPELTIVINQQREIVGYTVGNDMSSRSIEGENPLYLPQAKIYDGACALGPGIQLLDVAALSDLPIAIEITRQARSVFHGETRTSQIHRPLDELVAYLYRELSFPFGAFLMTGTGIVPPNSFTLAAGDRVTITIGTLTLENDIDTPRLGTGAD
jgi:2-dehydro-3-deoxy-D-arabinonate dehydratase